MKAIILSIFFFPVVALFAKGFDNKLSCKFVGEEQDMFVFEIYNASTDTAYVFDSYLQKCSDGFLYSSKYVHRYDKKTNTYKVSLLPILPLIAPKGCMNDKILFGKRKIIDTGQICFSFTKVSPMKSIEIRMDKNAFYSTEYIKDFHVENLSFLHSRLPKLHDIRKCHPTTVLLEFAVYKNIETLQKWCNDIDIDEYDKQGRLYTCISVVIKPY